MTHDFRAEKSYNHMTVALTQRTALRMFRESDFDPMMDVLGDPDVMRFGDGPQSADWTRSWIARTINNYAQGFGLWAVVLRKSENPIGYCGLSYFDDINGQPEIELGYRLAKKYWGSGLATEAASAVRDLAFGQLSLKRLISLIDPENWRSIRVAEKLGMIHTADAMLPGYTHPDRVYSCSPTSDNNCVNRSGESGGI
jgi:RimJ/RimL family protein N-acetyltransferase